MIKVLLKSASEDYISPKCIAVEIAAQNVLCGSGGEDGKAGAPGLWIDDDGEY